jgi:large subunit ribosomal protein L20
LVFAYRDRRVKKRDFRSLWIQRINAAARQCGVRYSELMNALAKSGMTIDRSALADLAVKDFGAFANLVEKVKPSITSAK